MSTSSVGIVAGVELDAAVARVCGIDGRPSDFGYPPCFFREVPTMSGGLVTYEEFRPSTDLNAAFEAAEKVGLFSSYDQFTIENHGGRWCLHREGGVHDGDTLALAICAAILALKESA